MRAQRRFFVEGVCDVDQVVALDRNDAHKVADVLRLRSGDAIEIIDSAAQEFEARLTFDGQEVHARVTKLRGGAEERGLAVTVAQALPKGRKMDFVVEKLTEFGVRAIVPVRSERTIASASAPRLERWRRLAKTAAQQSGRRRIPEVLAAVELRELFDRFEEYDVVLFAWELAQLEPLRTQLARILPPCVQRALIVIGPEGGFSHAEAEGAAGAGAHVISLGSRILRTETAALFLTAVLIFLTENP